MIRSVVNILFRIYENKISRCVLTVISVLLYANCYAQKEIALVNADSKSIQYQGRIGMNDPGVAEIYWPGSSVKLKFRGTGIKATLRDKRGNNYYNIIIDEDSVYVLKLDTNKTTYTLASDLPAGEHTVELFRRTGWTSGITWFYNFQLSPHSKILDLPVKKRVIEFYGNSITVGAAVENYVYAPGDTTDTNNSLSYGYLTAKRFDANYSCIASSGIGIMVSWGSLTMPEIYDRLNPYDSTSKWDFSKATPGIIVINLFQNDNALVNLPDHPQFKRRFGSKAPTEDFIIHSYGRFVQSIRGHYPDAHIICVLGNMDAVKPGSPWPGYIEKAVALLGDKKVYTCFFPYKNSPGHPDENEQRQMAEYLARFIDDHIKW
jgi:hypothetical protein